MHPSLMKLQGKTTARIYNNLGINYNQLKDYEKAIKYIQQAIQISKVHYD